MAEIVGIYAATHTPVMLNFPDSVPAADRDPIYAAYRELGHRISEARPQALVVVSNDHLHNFFLDNMPAFCVAAGDAYPTPIETWLKATPRTLRGDPALSAYLLHEAFAADFDPAFSMHLTLDHGTLTPLELGGFQVELPIVPVLVNCVQPPMPTMRRCLQFGRFLGRALRQYSGLERVAVLGTGGLSHDVGTPRMGLVNEAFDREFLRLLAGADGPLVDYTAAHVNEAGNGTEEVRNWLIAHGVADGGRPTVLHYRALQGWYTGIGLATWETRPQ